MSLITVTSDYTNNTGRQAVDPVYKGETTTATTTTNTTTETTTSSETKTYTITVNGKSYSIDLTADQRRLLLYTGFGILGYYLIKYLLKKAVKAIKEDDD